MTFIAHASCPSCSSCWARADILIDDGGYLIGNSFACDDCGTWWVEIREQSLTSGATSRDTPKDKPAEQVLRVRWGG